MKFLSYILMASTFWLVASSVHAGVITSIGSGTAVSSTLRQATFTGIKGSVLNYTENGLIISDEGKVCCFKDMFYAGGLRFGYTTITTPDSINFTGLEFDLGTGGGDGMLNVVWQTIRDGIVTGSGLFDVHATTGMARGFNVVGWYDPKGFDTLLVGAGPKPRYTALGQQQAMVLDNLRVGQVAVPEKPSAIPEPDALSVLGLGLALLALIRRKHS